MNMQTFLISYLSMTSYLQDTSIFRCYITVLTQNEATWCGWGQPISWISRVNRTRSLFSKFLFSTCATFLYLPKRQKTRNALKKKTTVKVYKWNKIALVLEQWPDFKLSCWISLSKRSREISNIKSKQYAHSYWQCVGYIHVTATMVEWFIVWCILNSLCIIVPKKKK